MRRALVAGGVVLLMLPHHLLAQQQSPTGVTLECPTGETCQDFALDPGEALITMVPGDTRRWSIAKVADYREIVHIVAKVNETYTWSGPMRTNIMLFTDRKIVELKLLGNNTSGRLSPLKEEKK